MFRNFILKLRNGHIKPFGSGNVNKTLPIVLLTRLEKPAQLPLQGQITADQLNKFLGTGDAHECSLHSIECMFCQLPYL